MQIIDPEIIYEKIVSLEWASDDVHMFEKIKGKLVLKSFNEDARSILCGENDKLPWEMLST